MTSRPESDPRIQGLLRAISIIYGCPVEELQALVRDEGLTVPDTQTVAHGEPVTSAEVTS